MSSRKNTRAGRSFFGCIAAMTALGLGLGGRIYPFQTENPLTILAFFADIGNGLLYLLSRFIPIGVGDLKLATFEFGTAYIAGAGLLNYPHRPRRARHRRGEEVMIFRSHLVSMILYAFFVAVVLALLRRTAKTRLKYGLFMFPSWSAARSSSAG